MGDVTVVAAARVRAGRIPRELQGMRRESERFRSYDPGGYRSTVCPRTQPGLCRGQGERNSSAGRYSDSLEEFAWSPVTGFAPSHYPFYYVSGEVRFTERRTGRKRAKRICLDCHNNELLAQQIRWSIEQGYGRQDGVAAPAAEMPDDAPPAEDPSASGTAIAAFGSSVTWKQDEAGTWRMHGLELTEPDMLPEGEDALLAEIEMGVLAAAGRADYDRQLAEAGIRSQAVKDVAAATSVNDSAVRRLVAMAEAGMRAQ